MKQYVAACAPHSRVPLDYGPNHDPIWVMTDACGNGIGGVVAQGPDWRSSKVAAFYSAKMSSAQRNYPVHEQELLAGVETMLRHRDILLDQKDLSGRQARWLEKLAEFDFDVKYVPGVDNVLPDALSRMYEFDEPGTIRAPSEYLHHDLYSLAWKPLLLLFAHERRQIPVHHHLRRLLHLPCPVCRTRSPLKIMT